METELPKRRKKKNNRKPIGRRNVLTAPKKPGYSRRFVNADDKSRIQMFLDAGYTIVNDNKSQKTQVGDEDTGNPQLLGSVAGKPVGGGIDAVLMEIPEDWYNEDQAAKETQIKQKEQGLLNDENGQIPDQKNLYGEGVNINANRPSIRSD